MSNDQQIGPSNYEQELTDEEKRKKEQQQYEDINAMVAKTQQGLQKVLKSSKKTMDNTSKTLKDMGSYGEAYNQFQQTWADKFNQHLTNVFGNQIDKNKKCSKEDLTKAANLLLKKQKVVIVIGGSADYITDLPITNQNLFATVQQKNEYQKLEKYFTNEYVQNNQKDS